MTAIPSNVTTTKGAPAATPIVTSQTTCFIELSTNELIINNLGAWNKTKTNETISFIFGPGGINPVSNCSSQGDMTFVVKTMATVNGEFFPIDEYAFNKQSADDKHVYNPIPRKAAFIYASVESSSVVAGTTNVGLTFIVKSSVEIPYNSVIQVTIPSDVRVNEE